MARRLRIAVWYHLPSGGAKRALNDHLRGLKANGHEIVAFRPPVPEVDYLPISDIVEEREVPLLPPDFPGRSRVERIFQASRTARGYRAAMIAHSQEVARQIDEGGFDVLFANTCMRYYSPWVGRYVKGPKLLYLQEPFRPFYEATFGSHWALPEEGEPPKGLRAKLRHYDAKLRYELQLYEHRRQVADELQNARSYDRILANSGYSRESILRAYALESEVCYLGIDADRFENRGLTREPFVISVGFFGPSKDPEFIVRSVGAIRENRPPLVWVANSAAPGYREKIEALARELEVDLTVHQNIPDAQLSDLMNRAAVVAYAPRLEPFGYAPLEANACGVPAVVVAEGGVKESVVDGLNGYVVPHRPEAMGTAIAGLLADPERARAMGERAATHVREAWSLERATNELERNLVEVASRSGAS